jgi:hypothetical protein
VVSDAEIGSYFHLSPEVIDIINNTCLICGHGAGDHTPDYCMVNGCECEVPDSIGCGLSQNGATQGTQVTARPHDDDVDVLTRFVSLNVSESSDIDAVSEIADTDEQSSVTKLDAGSSFVTITISREDAERWASDDDHIHATAWETVNKAIRAALEGER